MTQLNMSLPSKTKLAVEEFRERFGRWFPLDWNQTENRPRAIFRIAGASVPIGISIIIAALLAIIISGIATFFLPLSGFVHSFRGEILISFFENKFIVASGIIIGICVSGWVVGCRHLRDFGLEWSLKWGEDFAFGYIVGLAMYSGMVLAGIFAGWISITNIFSGPAWRIPILWTFLIFISSVCIGFREELIFRSLLLTNTAEAFRGFDWFNNTRAVVVALVVSSVGFGLLHIGGSVSKVIFSGVFGLLLGGMYVWTRSVAIPIGLHAGWDFAFFRLWGMRPGTTGNILEVSVNGPALLLGGTNWIGLFSFLAIFGGLAVVAPYIYIREGGLRVHSAIAIPDLHDNRTVWNIIHNPTQYIPFWDRVSLGPDRDDR
jgi:membrane protease YdiL (CAAX protease family)